MSKITILWLVALSLPCHEAFAPTIRTKSAENIRSSSASKLSVASPDVSGILSTGADQLQSLASSLPPIDELDGVLQGTFLEQIPLGAVAAVAALPVISRLAPFFKPRSKKPDQPTFPEQKAATYELLKDGPLEFGDPAFVRPLMKQTQLEYRNLRVVYDANKHGYNAKAFHNRVDGQGAAIILAKAGGQWFGGYNPRGWASLGGSRPSIAAFLFYKKPFGWQKLRVLGNGGMACGNDLFDSGIVMGAEGLVIPLGGSYPKSVASRLGTYFESGPDNRSTLLPRAGETVELQELKVLVGVYDKGEDIPNSGGVLDLGLY
jgi:hypothetical protein